MPRKLVGHWLMIAMIEKIDSNGYEWFVRYCLVIVSNQLMLETVTWLISNNG